jgi:uncharacterized membrane protein
METTSPVQVRERGRSWITPVVALAVLTVGLLFAFEATDASTTWFGVFKLIHVSVAVFWVGGGLLLTVLALRAERSNDTDELVTLARQATFAGEKLFAPAGGIVLAMGITMVINQHIGFGTAWIDIGLVGFALSFVTGVAVLAPRAKRIVELCETVGTTAPETQAAIREILVVARVDTAVLLLVVMDMLMKPFS